MGTKSETKKLIFLLVSCSLSRVFQLFWGFGVDVDSWSLAFSAKRIASDWGFYEASRLPGYPIPEHLFALAFKIFGFGFFQANFLAFIFGLLSTIGVWQLSKELKIKPLAPTLAFAFHPIIWVASTETMDYIFGVFFIVWSLYFYIKGRLLLSGAFLGLAAGSRITLAVALVAFVLDILRNKEGLKVCSNGKGLKAIAISIFKWSATFAIVSLLSFAPVFSTYGANFFSYSHIKINPFAALHRLLHEFFGVPFIIGFVIIFAIEKVLRKGGTKDLSPPSERKFILWAMFIVFWIPYLSFPLDAFYLASAVGFGILLLAIYFSERAFNVLAFLILLSSLISPFAVDKNEYRAHKRIKVKIVEAGPAINDALARVALCKEGIEFAEQLENLPKKSVYVMGDLFFYVSWDVLGKERWENIPFVYKHRLFLSTVPKGVLQRFKSLGWQIFYHEGMYVDYQTERAFGYSLKELGAKPIK